MHFLSLLKEKEYWEILSKNFLVIALIGMRPKTGFSLWIDFLRNA